MNVNKPFDSTLPLGSTTHPTYEATHLATHRVRKRMKDLFVAQSAKPEHLAEVNLTRLTPFQRVLLVTDGTVTRSIEAYTLSPVEVVVLDQEKQTLPSQHDWLELPAGAEIVARQVVLQTRSKGGELPTIHTYATSLIATQRLPQVIKEGLEIDGEGLGGLLRRGGLETRRDLLWCGLEHLEEVPEAIGHLEGEPFLSRTYRIVSDEEPLMLINERFPLGSTEK